MIRKYFAVLMLIGLGIIPTGCAFLGGAAAGSLAAGAGYEYQAKRQMDRLDNDLRSERISRREYEARKKQVESGSLVY